MGKYVLLGSYTAESIGKINASRTKKAAEIFKKLDGRLESIHALLGKYDLMVHAELPDIQAALKASLLLNKETGIRFQTLPALEVEQFDKLASGL